MIATRRSFLGFLAVAPFIVSAGALMPVKALRDDGLARFATDGQHPSGGHLYYTPTKFEVPILYFTNGRGFDDTEGHDPFSAVGQAALLRLGIFTRQEPA